MLFYAVIASSSEECLHQEAFVKNGWVVHNGEKFKEILEEKLKEFIPEIGTDLILDHAAFYVSDFSHDDYLIAWVEIWDRVSTERDEMWGDVAVSATGPCREEYIEIRWYDPIEQKRHIVCNPDFLSCLSTKIPLAYNTIF